MPCKTGECQKNCRENRVDGKNPNRLTLGVRYISTHFFTHAPCCDMMSPAPFVLQQIGIIHSPYHHRTEAPRQGRFSDQVSEIELFPAFVDGLEGIHRCSHMYVLWWGDRAERDILKVIPPGESVERGVFSTRSPARPNPIGLSLTRILSIEGRTIRVLWLDALDETPLLDIKPYSHGIDSLGEEAVDTHKTH